MERKHARKEQARRRVPKQPKVRRRVWRPHAVEGGEERHHIGAEWLCNQLLHDAVPTPQLLTTLGPSSPEEAMQEAQTAGRTDSRG